MFLIHGGYEKNSFLCMVVILGWDYTQKFFRVLHPTLFFVVPHTIFALKNAVKSIKQNFTMFLFHFPCTVDMFCYGLSH